MVLYTMAMNLVNNNVNKSQYDSLKKWRNYIFYRIKSTLEMSDLGLILQFKLTLHDYVTYVKGR